MGSSALRGCVARAGVVNQPLGLHAVQGPHSACYACPAAGAAELHDQAVFAVFCRGVLEGGKPCYSGLRQAVQRSPEVQAQLGFALSAGLAARVQAVLADAVAGPDLEAAKHIVAAGNSLMAGALLPLWQAAGSGSALQRQAAGQLLDAAQAALQLAAARPCPAPDEQSCAATLEAQSQAHLLQLALLPHAAGALGSGNHELAVRGRHAVLLAAPMAAAVLRTMPPPVFAIGLKIWLVSVRSVAQVAWISEQQTVEQRPQLQHALAAATALLRLLPQLDRQLQQARRASPPETQQEADRQLAAMGAAAIAMLEHVAGWAAAWTEAVPAAEATPALRRQLWQLLVTVSKVACAAADAWAVRSAAAAPAAAAPSAEGRAEPAVNAAAAALGEEAEEAGGASEAAGSSPLAHIVAAGLETFSAAAASLQRTADRLWAASGSADAQR